jgi:hypothetical protein
MSRDHTFYFSIEPKVLEKIVKDFQERFDTFLLDTFSDAELAQFENLIDQIAVFFVQPILAELSFDDFYPQRDQESFQRAFFETCRSSISVENLPYFENNPFQVSYLLDFLDSVGDVLIDRGGVEVLQFKKLYREHLQKFKSLDSLLGPLPILKLPRTNVPVHAIDFLVKDTYTELNQIKSDGKMALFMEEIKSLPTGMQKVIDVLHTGDFDAETLMIKSSLGPKEFGDQLERLKFFLRRINKG